MSLVDPFVQHIPRKLVDDPELRVYIEYLHRFLHDLWVRTGGGDDAITNADIQEKYPWDIPQGFSDHSQFVSAYSTDHAQNPSEIKVTYSSDGDSCAQLLIANNDSYVRFNPVTKSANYTLCDYDFVNASSGITLTMPQYPVDGSVAIIRNGDGSELTISGNGKNINGETTAVLRSKGAAITFQYFTDSDEWFSR